MRAMRCVIADRGARLSLPRVKIFALRQTYTRNASHDLSHLVREKCERTHFSNRSDYSVTKTRDKKNFVTADVSRDLPERNFATRRFDLAYCACNGFNIAKESLCQRLTTHARLSKRFPGNTGSCYTSSVRDSLEPKTVTYYTNSPCYVNTCSCIFYREQW